MQNGEGGMANGVRRPNGRLGLGGDFSLRDWPGWNLAMREGMGGLTRPVDSSFRVAGICFDPLSPLL